MDRNTALTRLQQLERQISSLHAQRACLLVEVASAAPVIDELFVLDPRPGHDEERIIRIEDAAREEIAAALRWSPPTAHARIDEARLLAGPLRETLDALRTGDIASGHVAVIVEAARRLRGRFHASPALRASFERRCRLLEKRVLPVAKCGTVASTRRAANRVVLLIDPEGAGHRRDEQLRTRGVRISDELDGVSTLTARLATVDAHAIKAAVDLRAEHLPDGTPIGERRAEALRDLVLDHGSTHQVQLNLDVVVSADALLGGAEDAAELGGAVIGSGEVGSLLTDPAVTVTMRRLITDPLTGHLLDRSPRRYRIPDSLRAFIAARDGHCRFPGCRRKATACQIDHAHAFEDGGATTVANLGPLCLRHHQLKTHGGWRIIDSRADGSCTWVSPLGRRYHHPPRRILPTEDPPLS